jgi:catechol 2,3-dioxygenase-like lactoylglutathione lyase family enzyme
MAIIRHIAYRAADVDAMAKFFIEAFGMKLIQKREWENNAIDLSNGLINISFYQLPQTVAGERDWSISNFPRLIIRSRSAGSKRQAE